MSGNTSWDTIVFPPKEYFPDAVYNIAGAAPGVLPNIFVLIVGIKGRIPGRFRYSIVGMAWCQLYAAVMQTILYILYFVYSHNEVPMTVLECSIPRRVLQVTIYPAMLSTLVVSVDRYFTIVRNFQMTPLAVAGCYSLPFLYGHGVYNTLTFAFNTFGTSDICGYAYKMPSYLSVYFEPVIPCSMFVSFIINARIVLFLVSYKARGTKAGKTYTERELRDLKHAMMGLCLQVAIPFCFNMPQIINLAMYNINTALRLPKQTWMIINFLNYFTLFLNPMTTICFVKSFRRESLRMVGRGKFSETSSTNRNGQMMSSVVRNTRSVVTAPASMPPVR